MDNQTKLIRIKDAARLLGVTTLTLRNWDNAGKLKALRHPLNNYRVYRRSDIEKLLEDIDKNVSPKRTPKKAIRRLDVTHIKENF